MNPDELRQASKAMLETDLPTESILDGSYLRATTSPLVPVSAFMQGETEINWLLPDLIPSGSLVVLYGAPKSGKSIFALNLALATVVMGKSFIRRKSTGGRVGIVQLEDPEILVRNRIKTMIDYVPEGLFISAGRPWNEEQRENLAFYINELSLQLLVIDPLILWKPGARENVAEEMAELMYGLRQVTMLTGCSILVVHHARKGEGAYGDNMRGSSAILGACDIAVELQRKDEWEAAMRVVSRLGTVEPETLELDPETLTWYSLGPEGAQKTQERRQQIVRFIKTHSPVTADAIKTEFAVKRTTLYRDIGFLENKHVITSSNGESSGGRNAKIYTFVPDSKLCPIPPSPKGEKVGKRWEKD